VADPKKPDPKDEDVRATSPPDPKDIPWAPDDVSETQPPPK
jgi:hypothetical protein